MMKSNLNRIFPLFLVLFLITSFVYVGFPVIQSKGIVQGISTIPPAKVPIINKYHIFIDTSPSFIGKVEGIQEKKATDYLDSDNYFNEYYSKSIDFLSNFFSSSHEWYWGEKDTVTFYTLEGDVSAGITDGIDSSRKIADEEYGLGNLKKRDEVTRLINRVLKHLNNKNPNKKNIRSDIVECIERINQIVTSSQQPDHTFHHFMIISDMAHETVGKKSQLVENAKNEINTALRKIVTSDDWKEHFKDKFTRNADVLFLNFDLNIDQRRVRNRSIKGYKPYYGKEYQDTSTMTMDTLKKIYSWDFIRTKDNDDAGKLNKEWYSSFLKDKYKNIPIEVMNYRVASSEIRKKNTVFWEVALFNHSPVAITPPPFQINLNSKKFFSSSEPLPEIQPGETRFINEVKIPLHEKWFDSLLPKKRISLSSFSEEQAYRENSFTIYNTTQFMPLTFFCLLFFFYRIYRKDISETFNALFHDERKQKPYRNIFTFFGGVVTSTWEIIGYVILIFGGSISQYIVLFWGEWSEHVPSYNNWVFLIFYVLTLLFIPLFITYGVKHYLLSLYRQGQELIDKGDGKLSFDLLGRLKNDANIIRGIFWMVTFVLILLLFTIPIHRWIEYFLLILN